MVLYHYLNNKEKFLERQKEYYEKNKSEILLEKEKRKSTQKKYYQNNREKILERQREYYKKKTNGLH